MAHRFAVPARLAAGALTTAATAWAARQNVTLSMQNLVAANGTIVAVLSLGFRSGGGNAFDLGGVAGAEIQCVAELGSGSL